jgi:hypothetical protein
MSALKLIGEYLIADGLITPEQLEQGLQKQAALTERGHMPLLGTVLVQLGAVQEQDLAFALEEQERERMRIQA